MYWISDNVRHRDDNAFFVYDDPNHSRMHKLMVTSKKVEFTNREYFEIAKIFDRQVMKDDFDTSF